MSKISVNHSIDNEGGSSNVIIISKSRLSSSKKLHNYMTIQDGELKLKVKMNKKTLTKEDINKAITSLKNNRTLGMLEYDKNKIELYLKRRNNNKELNKIKLLEKMKKSNLSVETTRSWNFIKASESKEEENNNDNINAKMEDAKENIDRETIDININDENNNNNNKINSNASKVYYSQNFINNSRNNKKLIKVKPIDNHVSEEINIKNSSGLNSKRDNNNEKNKQSSDRALAEQVSKQILESIIPQVGNDFHEYNHINTKNLITENDNNQLSKSKNELLTENNIQINNEKEEEKLENCDENWQNNINFNIINLNTNESNKSDDEEKKIQKTKNDLGEQQTINNKNYNNNTDLINSININKNKYYKQTHQICEICDFTYVIDKFFLPECKQHYICKKCTKNYYEEKIEEGIKDLFCPFIKCGAQINIKDLKKFISLEHYNRLCLMNQKEKNNSDENKNSFYFTKIKTDINKSNIQSYTKRNVIDINSNKDFFNYNSIRGCFCPHCYQESLFSKTNTRFFKCLNCEIRLCKLCFKQFTVNHLEINNLEHCKVFYRIEENLNFKKNQIIIHLLLQIFFVFASFFICFGGSFFRMKDIFFYLFNINNRSIIKYIFGYFFIIIFFIISVPFIFLLYPYFPSIMALFN